ncbi:fructose-bisphosphate aldolase class I [Candidatus Parcubacteria bacterium]|nr:fructose-bisphosphate aldolase class I [Candidatus Parcubacteria bacterium]
MKSEILQNTIQKLFAKDRGILAADESVASINKRFEALNIDQTVENRLAFRKTLIATPELHNYISGVIFHDETFRQEIEAGKTFAQYCEENNIIPGIKVDEGLAEFPNFNGEKITMGIDGLRKRFEEYFNLGARFCKWRVVVDVKASTDEIIELNLRNLAIYASLAQEAGIVPIIEPEVMYDGEHTIEECREKLSFVLTHLFGDLAIYRVDIKNVILKTAMVLSGKKSIVKAESDEIAGDTSHILLSTVPETIGGVVFLSGGQTPTEASLNLSKIMALGPYKFPITYSYSRALQDPVLEAFSQGKDIDTTRKIFIDRLEMNTLALEGKYTLENETGLSSHINNVTHSQDL